MTFRPWWAKKNVRKIPDDVMKLLVEMPWKGNVRELENALTRAVILAKGEFILRENLPLEAMDDKVIRRELVPLKEVEKTYIQYVLNMAKGNKTRTCQILQISRPTLDKKIREYKLEVMSSAVL
jgi:two-component system response regulator AtoC